MNAGPPHTYYTSQITTGNPTSFQCNSLSTSRCLAAASNDGRSSLCSRTVIQLTNQRKLVSRVLLQPTNSWLVCLGVKLLHEFWCNFCEPLFRLLTRPHWAVIISHYLEQVVQRWTICIRSLSWLWTCWLWLDEAGEGGLFTALSQSRYVKHASCGWLCNQWLLYHSSSTTSPLQVWAAHIFCALSLVVNMFIPWFCTTSARYLHNPVI
jgi:hypothetical protein